MRDLIDRQAAIDELTKYIHNVDKVIGTGKLSEADCRDAAESVFEEIPTADAVPVVRCKECKYSYIFEPWEGEDAVRYCNRLRWACAKDSDLPVYDDDFCSHGERREE